eukprot:8391902-Pyramimonas_sp.AAC.1
MIVARRVGAVCAHYDHQSVCMAYAVRSLSPMVASAAAPEKVPANSPVVGWLNKGLTAWIIPCRGRC